MMFPGQWTGKESIVTTGISAEKYMLRVVMMALRDGLAEGVLVSVLRPEPGGEFSGPQPASHWNTENVEPRFSYCMIDPRNPFSGGVAGDGYQYIFITRESLDAFKSARQKPARAEPPREIAAPPTRDEVVNFFLEIKELWKTNSKSKDYRVTREEFEALVSRRFPGATTSISRPVFDEYRPEEWARSGKFVRSPGALEVVARALGVRFQ